MPPKPDRSMHISPSGMRCEIVHISPYGMRCEIARPEVTAVQAATDEYIREQRAARVARARVLVASWFARRRRRASALRGVLSR